LKLGPLAHLLVVDYTTNARTLLCNPINTLLLLLHFFFHHGSVENLGVIHSFVRAVRPMRSIMQYFVVCRIIAPFIHRIVSNVDLLRGILVEMLTALKDLEGVIATHNVEYYVTDDSNNPLCYLKLIIDFFYECKNLYKLKQTTLDAMKEVIAHFDPILQNYFKHF